MARNRERIIEGARLMLEGLGEDIGRAGLIDTPSRVASALLEMTAGSLVDAHEVLGRTFPAEDYDEMIAVGPIDYFSLCEHHVLPFFGTAFVAYIPSKECIVGLSKLARVVDIFSRRLQVQERMTKEIAEALQVVLQPKGYGVVVRGKHMCMCARGVGKPRAWMTTTQLGGAMKNDASCREEFLSYVRTCGTGD